MDRGLHSRSGRHHVSIHACFFATRGGRESKPMPNHLRVSTGSLTSTHGKRYLSTAKSN